MLVPQVPHKGPKELVIAFDFGTTYSGAAICLLNPGEVPDPRPVMPWPGVGWAKFASIVYYTKANGGLHAYGSADELESTEIEDALAAGELEAARNFKLCLGGILDNAWKQGVDIKLMMSHPNGWEGSQQSALRRACEMAKITSCPDHDVELNFIAEGEACLHFVSSQLEDGDVVVVVDAGGGTIDISTYECSNGVYNEVALPDCLYAGSITLDRAAEVLVDSVLEDTSARNRAYKEWKRVKLLLKETTKDVTLSLYMNEDTTPPPNTTRRNAPAYVKGSDLIITKAGIKEIFKSSVDSTVSSILDKMDYCANLREALQVNRVVFLGGLGDSQYYRSEVEKRVIASGSSRVTFCKADEAHSKAVALGAARAAASNIVELHLAPMHFGIEVQMEFDASNPEHRLRAHKKHQDPVTGKWYLGGIFSRLISKGERGSSNAGPSEPFSITTWTDNLACTDDEVFEFRGHECPEWLDEGNFDKLLRVQLDIAREDFECKAKVNAEGLEVYEWNYELQFRLFGTELEAVCSQGSKRASHPGIVGAAKRSTKPVQKAKSNKRPRRD
ncbi:hypothetical protein IE81DRAFT_344141 [Ceraceosorus guamensis]|uniref:Actin-like ATPase domain-containing protein n=1 Tax=Ceraceosorus guamensis TaxID=1522189 RepID=A0A316W862_9BASI|nr:hypothetical protein IE81DRAFT_344141 [Ceraceosorus guamensis]PWN46077.1 hypothetical protein IE81DRAFT_344141 [Ceraceosorus guamensis]